MKVLPPAILTANAAAAGPRPDTLPTRLPLSSPSASPTSSVQPLSLPRSTSTNRSGMADVRLYRMHVPASTDGLHVAPPKLRHGTTCYVPAVLARFLAGLLGLSSSATGTSRCTRNYPTEPPAASTRLMGRPDSATLRLTTPPPAVAARNDSSSAAIAVATDTVATIPETRTAAAAPDQVAVSAATTAAPATAPHPAPLVPELLVALVGEEGTMRLTSATLRKRTMTREEKGSRGEKGPSEAATSSGDGGVASGPPGVGVAAAPLRRRSRLALTLAAAAVAAEEEDVTVAAAAVDAAASCARSKDVCVQGFDLYVSAGGRHVLLLVHVGAGKHQQQLQQQLQLHRLPQWQQHHVPRAATTGDRSLPSFTGWAAPWSGAVEQKAQGKTAGALVPVLVSTAEPPPECAATPSPSSSAQRPPASKRPSDADGAASGGEDRRVHPSLRWPHAPPLNAAAAPDVAAAQQQHRTAAAGALLLLGSLDTSQQHQHQQHQQHLPQLQWAQQPQQRRQSHGVEMPSRRGGVEEEERAARLGAEAELRAVRAQLQEARGAQRSAEAHVERLRGELRSRIGMERVAVQKVEELIGGQHAALMAAEGRAREAAAAAAGLRAALEAEQAARVDAERKVSNFRALFERGMRA